MTQPSTHPSGETGRTETPRTDEAICEAETMVWDDYAIAFYHMGEFASQLERELTAAQADRDTYKDEFSRAVQAALPLQDSKLAEEIGLRLGENITTEGMTLLLAAYARVKAERDAAQAALRRIERWFGEFPETGRYWDEPENTRPMSYSACYGSNGERDYMRAVARAALGGKHG